MKCTYRIYKDSHVVDELLMRNKDRLKLIFATENCTLTKVNLKQVITVITQSLGTS